jgi:hypothetical protein
MTDQRIDMIANLDYQRAYTFLEMIFQQRKRAAQLLRECSDEGSKVSTIQFIRSCDDVIKAALCL